MKKIVLGILAGFVLFILIPAVLIYLKGHGFSAPGEASLPRADNAPGSEASAANSPTAIQPQDPEAQKQAAKDQMEKIRRALRATLAQPKYAYIVMRQEGLEDELMRQMMIMAKLGQVKTVGQAVTELVDNRMQTDLVTEANKEVRLKEVQEFYFKKIRGSNYEKRRALCESAGGSFTGSAEYVGDLVDQFLRACVCTNKGKSIGQLASSKPVLFALNCDSP